MPGGVDRCKGICKIGINIQLVWVPRGVRTYYKSQGSKILKYNNENSLKDPPTNVFFNGDCTQNHTVQLETTHG